MSVELEQLLRADGAGEPRGWAMEARDRGTKLHSKLFSSLADAAKRLVNERDRTRTVGGISRHRMAAEPTAEPTVPVSAFKMVGLADLQAQLADRWPALAEKVHATAQSTIERHLVRGDVFERQGDDGYLVLFATLGAEEAEFKSRIIARDIAERLLGEAGAAGLKIATRCASIPADALVSGDLNSVVSEALAAAWDGDPESSGRATRSDAEDSGQAPRAERQSYSPVWDTRQMTLLHFRAHRARAVEEFESRTSEVQAYRTNLALLQAVALDLQGLSDEGRRLPVTVSLDHASLVSNSQRASLVQALAAIPPQQRKLLTLEIGAAADEFWSYGCKSFLEMIRPLGVSLSALVGLDDAPAMPRGGALKSIATDLAGVALAEAASLRLLTSFADSVRGYGFECAAYGLGSRALVLGAIGAGFRYVAGPAVHADVGSLATALRFEPLDLYADVQRLTARP